MPLQFGLKDDACSSWSPPSLAHLDQPPVFQFKAREPRDEARFYHFVRRNGLYPVPEADIRAEIVKVLRASWSPKTFAAEHPRLLKLWAAVDRGEDLSTEDAAAVGELEVRCATISRRLALLVERRDRFKAEAPGYALAFFLRGWEGVDAPFMREGATVMMACLVVLKGKLQKLEEQAAAAGVPGVVPGLAITELALHALGLLAPVDDDDQVVAEADPEPVGEAA